MERFSDFADIKPLLEGDKVKIDNILNKEIIITGYRIDKSKFGDNGDKYCRIQFKETEKDNFHVVFTGSLVLIDQLVHADGHFPFLTIIKKQNKYYTLS